MTPTLKGVMRAASLVVLVAAGAVPQARAEVVAKFRATGAFMSASGLESSGCAWFYVQVNRGGTKAAQQTWLYYSVYDACSGESSYGYGLVPNSVLATRASVSSLDVTPAEVPGFQAVGLTGRILLHARADGRFSYSFSGHSRQQMRDRAVRSHGSSTSQSAGLGGSFFGYLVTSAGGEVGESREKWMEIEQGGAG